MCIRNKGEGYVSVVLKQNRQFQNSNSVPQEARNTKDQLHYTASIIVSSSLYPWILCASCKVSKCFTKKLSQSVLLKSCSLADTLMKFFSLVEAPMILILSGKYIKIKQKKNHQTLINLLKQIKVMTELTYSIFNKKDFQQATGITQRFKSAKTQFCLFVCTSVH